MKKHSSEEGTVPTIFAGSAKKAGFKMPQGGQIPTIWGEAAHAQKTGEFHPKGGYHKSDSIIPGMGGIPGLEGSHGGHGKCQGCGGPLGNDGGTGLCSKCMHGY